MFTTHRTLVIVVVQLLSCVHLCDPKECSPPGSPVFHYLQEFAQIHVYWVNDAIQPSHPLLLPSPFAFSLSQNQCLFQGIGSLHQVTKVLELQLQYQSFQWIFRVNFLWDWLVGSLCCPRDSQRVFSSNTIWKRWFFATQPSLWSNSHFSYLYMTTGKNNSLTIWTFASKMMSV